MCHDKDYSLHYRYGTYYQKNKNKGDIEKGFRDGLWTGVEYEERYKSEK